MPTKDNKPPLELQSHFRIQHCLHRCCEAGHQVTEDLEFEPVITKIRDDDIEIARALRGPTCTMTEYFAHFIPRTRGGLDGTTLLHDNPAIPCSSEACKHLASVISISTHWPLVLHIKPSDSKPLSNPTAFEIHCTYGPPVTYQLVGRVLWHGPKELHFTAQVLIDGNTYLYNDMANDGRLHLSGDKQQFDETEKIVVYCVYHRDSQNSKVRCSMLVSIYNLMFTCTI